MSFSINLNEVKDRSDIKNGYNNVTIVKAELVTTKKGGQMVTLKCSIEDTGVFSYKNYNIVNANPAVETRDRNSLGVVARLCGIDGDLTPERLIELCGHTLSAYIKMETNQETGALRPEITSFKKL